MTTRPRGADLLRDPHQNKFTGFTEAERVGLKLKGLLPEGIENLDTQVERALLQLEQRTSPLDKYLYLSELQDIDETLFYRLLTSDPARLLPFVYTPTVGDACLQFSHIMRRPKGLYVSINRKGRSARDSPQLARREMCDSSWSPAANEFWASAISAPTGWEFRSASLRSTRRAPEFRRSFRYRS